MTRVLLFTAPRARVTTNPHKTKSGGARARIEDHGGEVATKVRYFGVKSTNGCRAQMGTKPAKVTHRPSWPTKAAIKRITRCKNLYPVYPVYMSSSRLRHLAQTLVIMINL